MPITKEHYELVRNHFLILLGGKCSCGESDKNRLHLHHPKGTELENGNVNGKNPYSGRGRERRMWEWFEAYRNRNLEIECKECHKTIKQNNFK